MFKMNKVFQFSRQYCTKSGKFPNPHLAKVVPKDIWAEVKDPKWTQTEVVEGRWEWVERLFPKLRIPEPAKSASSAGWRAPSASVPNFPYFVKRSRNHMLPVYENRVYQERVLVTQVDGVQGDIWVFEQDLKKFLKKELSRNIESHVNEMGCFVNVKGNHVDLIKEWLYDKGF